MGGDFTELIPAAFICAAAIFLLLCADQISARRRARAAAIRRHPSNQPAHIPSQRRPS